MTRCGRVAALLAGLAAASAAAGVVALRRDNSGEFLRLRAGGGPPVAVWRRDSALSSTRLLAFADRRGEAISTAFVRLPHRLDPHYRMLLTYAGQGTDEKILGLVPDRPDLVLAAAQYPFEKPSSRPGRLLVPFLARRAAYRAVAGGMLAADHLIGETGLDPARLIVVGASLGSIPATIHAALDPRVTRLLVVHGGGGFPGLFEHLFAAQGAGPMAAPAAWLADLIVGSFDPVRFIARVSPRPLHMIASRGDAYFPVASALALYNAARPPKSIHWTGTDHVRSRRPDLAAEIVRQLEAWLAREDVRQAAGGVAPAVAGPGP